MKITARGVGVLVAAVALFGAGFGFGYPELTVIATTAAVALVSAVGYVAGRPRLSVRRSCEPDRVMRGEASLVTLTVGNTSRLRTATLVAYDRCGSTDVPVPLLRLRAGRETTAQYQVPTARRGVVDVGPLRVVRRDPLGLLTLPRSHGGTERVWVYPRVHPLRSVPAGVARNLDGLVDRVPQGSITFDTLREYVVGDELRHVHWRTSARIGELMVREHLDTSLPRLVILLDDRSAAYQGREGAAAFEAACEAAASILLAATRDELPVALHLVSGAAVGAGGTTGDRRQTTGPFLDLLAETTLASTEPAGDGDPLHRATSRLRHNRPGDTLIFLTGPGRREDIGLVAGLHRAYTSVVVGTLGVREPAPAMEGVALHRSPLFTPKGLHNEAQGQRS